jgi:aconitate hydratase
MIAAGLLAQRAVARGLTVPAHVKTSLSPGSRAVTRYLVDAGLLAPLEALGFHVVGYGCATCNGGSGPLSPELDGVDDLAAVLSGNRNFAGRVHARVRSAYLASPPLVVAFALAGHLGLDLELLAELWPSDAEIAAVVARVVTPAVFRVVDPPPPGWREIEAATGPRYAWDDASTYIRRPPYFDGQARAPEIRDARVLVRLGDDVSTDQISPVGAIAATSSAGRYLAARGVPTEAFNSHGSRRGNHEVMARATFGPGIHEAAERHAGAPLIVIAGERYGMGSSRDWAARGPWFLGVRAVLARSFERIHRGNLVAMGILPIEITADLATFERFTVDTAGLAPRAAIEVIADGERFAGVARIDSDDELAIYRRGGMLPYLLEAACAA